MDSQKQQILERIKQANNILITVSANPSVDQLAACLGLTIMLNELGKHATAVFSGNVPSIIEFLQPEKTLEKNTDSLRDFIIALDKAKADKLRYKVEDTVVKIFITPYRTSISDKDLEFSQGDFNVEVVVALGVHDQKDLDKAITAHGRILHDATVMSINTTAGNNLGTINWQDPKASSLSEMVTSLAENFDKKVLDNQVATALLTGIVAETERFSNSKTSPDTMKASASLMAAGANQQLVATKLQEPVAPIPMPISAPSPAAGASEQIPEVARSEDGTLQIEHSAAEIAQEKEKEEEQKKTEETVQSTEPEIESPKKPEAQIHIDDQGLLHRLGDDRELLAGSGPSADGSNAESEMAADDEQPSGEPMVTEGSKFVFNPPTLGGTLTANSRPEEELEPTTDPLSSADENQQPMLTHNEPSSGLNNASPLVIKPPEETGKDTKLDHSSISQPPADTKEDESVTPPSITLPEPQIDPAPVTPDVAPFEMPAPVLEPLTSPTPVSDDGDSNQTGFMPEPVTQDATASSNDLSNVIMPTTSDDDSFPPADVNSARDAVMNAIGAGGSDDAPSPIAALNAQPLGSPLHETQSDDALGQGAPTSGLPIIQPLGNPNFNEAAPDAASPSAQPMDMPLPPTLTPPPANVMPPTSSQADNPTAPPPVPPPMMPPFTNPSGQ